MKDLFIVKDENGARVISTNTLIQELRGKLLNITTYRRSDVERFAGEIMEHMCGDSITSEMYDGYLDKWSKVIVDYYNLTPWKFMCMQES